MSKNEIAKPIDIRFQMERETKNAVRFQEIDAEGKVLDNDACQIGTLYIKKRAFKSAIPNQIVVTLS